jgi:hypothetical protein
VGLRHRGWHGRVKDPDGGELAGLLRAHRKRPNGTVVLARPAMKWRRLMGVALEPEQLMSALGQKQT